MLRNRFLTSDRDTRDHVFLQVRASATRDRALLLRSKRQFHLPDVDAAGLRNWQPVGEQPLEM